MMLIRGCLIFIIFILAPPSFGEEKPGYFLTGNNLNELCQTDRPQVTGYLMGFSDAYSIKDEMGAKPVVCPPAGVVSTQFADVVCRYLEENPEHRHWRAAYQVHNALIGAWPCQ